MNGKIIPEELEKRIEVHPEELEKRIEVHPENIVLSHAFNKNYDELLNKPQINNIELTGNKLFEDLGIKEITNTELNNLFKDI